MNLEGRAFLVTGAASGIGRTTATALARRGARLGLIDRDTAGLDATVAALEECTDVATKCLDLSDLDSVGPAVSELADRLGGLDGAVNSAGLLGRFGKTARVDIADMRRLFEVNVFGLFACMKAEIEALIPSGRGSIVNLASGAGLVGSAGLSAYSASKHAVIGFTRSAALDHGADGIRVNAVCPGLVTTPMINGSISDAMAKAATAEHPIGRLCRPEEVTEMIIWLLSDEASFVTGAAMSVDGGFTAH